jgi:sugar phosphate isomerase/epimerase
LKFAICNELFQGWSLERIFDYTSQLGYDAVEIAPFTISEDIRTVGKEERRRIRENAASHNLDVTGIHWLLVTPKGLHLTHPDERVRRRTTQYLCELIKFTSDIGGKFLVFGSPQQRNMMDGVSKGQAWNFAKEIFSECSRFAKDYGAVICVEPLARHLTNFINTAEEAIRLIEEVSHPNLRLILDVFSMLDEEKPMDEIIRSGKDYLAHFHANDANRLGPGFGEVDYKPIVKALKEINYRGFVSVEVFDFTPGPEEIARRSLESLRKFWGEKAKR